jgi:AGCS family alanine or glycine:cation symporter
MNYKICDASRITHQTSSVEPAASGCCRCMIVQDMSEGPDGLTQSEPPIHVPCLINRILHMIIKLVGAINDLLWGDLIILEFSGGEVQFGLSLLVLILIPAGLYFTFKTKFLPFRLFPEMIRVTLEKDDAKKDENSISGVQALIVATATRVGMGNLAGVVAAISFGGAGAVFWMWLTALIGSSSSFVESTLAQIYKEKDPLYGGYRGGPAYVMDRIRLVTKIKREDVFVKNVKEEAEYVADDEQTYYTRGCKYGLLGTAFALSGLLCWAGISQVIGNSVTTSFQNAFGIPQVATATILVAMSAVIVLRKNATVKVLDMVVPVMAGAYFLVTLFVIIKNITLLPSVIGNIFSQAFGIRQFAGGGLGVIVMNGVKRGLFSNEAGSGSAPCAAAAAEVSHPVKQGLIQALGVFIDTLVICSCSAFLMLLAPAEKIEGLMGMDLLQAAMNHHLGYAGVVFIAVVLFLFSFSTFLGILYYARCNVSYVFGDTWKAQTGYKIFLLIMLFIGGVAAYEFVWELGDLGVGLMTVFNMIAIVPLSGQAINALKDYETNYKKKKA